MIRYPLRYGGLVREILEKKLGKISRREILPRWHNIITWVVKLLKK